MSEIIRRTHQVNLRVTDKEKKELDKRAKEQNQTLSSYIINAALYSNNVVNPNKIAEAMIQTSIVVDQLMEEYSEERSLATENNLLDAINKLSQGVVELYGCFKNR